jgi:hypothetical protein
MGARWRHYACYARPAQLLPSLGTLSSLIPSPVSRSVSVTGSGSIAHASVSNPGYVVYINYGRVYITFCAAREVGEVGGTVCMCTYI